MHTPTSIFFFINRRTTTLVKEKNNWSVDGVSVQRWKEHLVTSLALPFVEVLFYTYFVFGEVGIREQCFRRAVPIPGPSPLFWTLRWLGEQLIWMAWAWALGTWSETFALWGGWSGGRVRPALYILEWESPSPQGCGKGRKGRGAEQSMTRLQFKAFPRGG